MDSPAPLAITGTGALCAAGVGVDEVMGSILAGRSAVTTIESWDVGDWPVRIAAEVVGVAARTLVADRKLPKRIGRTDLFGLHVADAAIEAAGLMESAAGHDRAFAERSGVFAGCGGGNYDCNYDFLPLLVDAKGDLGVFGRELASRVSPLWLLRILPNNVVCYVGIRRGFKGVNGCVTNEGVAGAQAIIEAADAVRSGKADRMVAIGHDAPIEPERILRFDHVGLLSRSGLRPFDVSRDGTVLGEGAAAVVLEPCAQARGRGAKVLGELLGSGCTSEATGVLPVRPDGEGLSRAIDLALAEANLKPEAVGMVVAHGNGTLDSDSSEVAALVRVFGDRLPPVTAFKWALGHMLGGAGAMQLVLAVECLRRSVVPGIATLECLDPEFAGFPVSSTACAPVSDVALVLSRGFGGMNVAQLVRADADLAVTR